MTYDAYWVPGLDDDIADELSLGTAFDWLKQAELEHGGRGVVVMYAVSMVNNNPALQQARRWDVVSTRSHHAGRGAGPALCIWPSTPGTLELAERLAFKTALCVVPGSLMSIEPWIRKTNATCLVDGFAAPPVPTMPDDIAKILDGMLFFGGHNQFLGSAKEDAIRRMRTFASRPDAPSRETLEAYLLASNKTTADGARRAGHFYERIRTGRSMRDYRGRPI